MIGYEATGSSQPVLPTSDPRSFQPQYGSVPTLEGYGLCGSVVRLLPYLVVCFCGSGDSLYVTALFSVLLLSFLLQITMTY